MAELVDRYVAVTGDSFKKTINDALRNALTPQQAKKVVTRTSAMGAPRVDLDRALQLAAALEDDAILAAMR